MLLKVEAYHDGDFWCARAIGQDIFTQGATMDELIQNIKEAVTLHFEDDILSSVSIWTGVAKDDLIDRL